MLNLVWVVIAPESMLVPDLPDFENPFVPVMVHAATPVELHEIFVVPPDGTSVGLALIVAVLPTIEQVSELG
jgi:hypothetical protein